MTRPLTTTETVKAKNEIPVEAPGANAVVLGWQSPTDMANGATLKKFAFSANTPQFDTSLHLTRANTTENVDPTLAELEAVYGAGNVTLASGVDVEVALANGVNELWEVTGTAPLTWDRRRAITAATISVADIAVAAPMPGHTFGTGTPVGQFAPRAGSWDRDGGGNVSLANNVTRYTANVHIVGVQDANTVLVIPIGFRGVLDLPGEALTAGHQYFVQDDGTISSTASSFRLYQAWSATQIYLDYHVQAGAPVTGFEGIYTSDDPSFYYVAGTNLADGAWQVNRYATATYTKTRANEANNAGQTTLPAAAALAGLTYA